MRRTSVSSLLLYSALVLAFLIIADALVSLYLTCNYVESGPPCRYDEQEYYGTGNALLLRFLYFALFDASSNQVIAAFTVVLAFTTIGLFWIGYQQLADTRILQRAYLDIEPLGVLPFHFKYKSFGHIGIKNSGRLPASNVQWNLCVEPSNDRRFQPTDLEIEEEDWSSVLAPGATMVVACEAEPNLITEEIYKTLARAKHKAREKDWYIYVWGIVRYEDGFENPRFTRFCHRYFFRGFVHHLDEPAHKGMSGLTADYGVRHHEWGNDAD